MQQVKSSAAVNIEKEVYQLLSLGSRLHRISFLWEILQTYQEHEVKLEEWTQNIPLIKEREKLPMSKFISNWKNYTLNFANK